VKKAALGAAVLLLSPLLGFASGSEWETLKRHGLEQVSTGEMYFWSASQGAPLTIAWVRRHCGPCWKELEALRARKEREPAFPVVAVVLETASRDEAALHFRRLKLNFPLLLSTPALERALDPPIRATPELWEWNTERTHLKRSRPTLGETQP
jgi:hypothetical protein